MQQPSAHPSGTFDIGGDLTVHRLGFGAMRITGRGIWGDPVDPAEARRVLARLPDLGVDLIDTADSYGPFVSEDLIREEMRQDHVRHDAFEVLERTPKLAARAAA